MKKNFKIVSSMALAAMLTISSIGTNSFAAVTENQTKTEPVSIYRNLIAGKTAVPFVLANRDDRVTIKDIKESEQFNITKFNGIAVPSENTIVGTGDTFVSNGEEYTVVVYGDVDGNGAINSIDALDVEKHITKIEKLDSVQQEAGDVVNDDELNSLDSLAIKKYIVGLQDPVINKLPAEEVQDSNYTVTVNDNGVVNNVNVSSSKVTIKLTEELTEDMTGVSIKAPGKDGTEKTIKTGVTIPAYTSQVTVDAINMSSIAEGKITGKIVATIDGKETVLGTFNFEKNTKDIPKASQIITNRVSTPEATISFNSCGESDITKMYYVIEVIKEVPASDEPEKADVLKGKTIDVNGSKLENAVISEELKNNKAYKIYYVLENSYGSTSEVSSTVITKDTEDVIEEKKIQEITVPPLEKEGEKITEANFELVLAEGEEATGKTFIITIFKDGKAIKEIERSGNTTINLATSMTEAGKYKISAVVKGNDAGTRKTSEATESAEVEVVALNPVRNITFNINEKGKKVLAWESDYNAEDIEGYQVKLYNLVDGEYVEATTLNSTEKQTKITIADNTIYKAEITVMAKDGQLAKIDSASETSKDFFTVNTNTITPASETEDSVTLNLTAPVNVEGKTTTYSVEVYEVTGEDGTVAAKYKLLETKTNVEMKDNKIVVDGLESNKAYTFKLIANVEGIEGESGFTTEVTTLHEMPEIKNMTVSTEAGEGKIAKIGSDLSINNVLIKQADFAKYPAEVAKIAEIMATLVPEDVITLEGDKLTLVLPNKATAGTEYVRNFRTTTKGMTIEIEGNKFSKTIKATDGSEPKEVILKGEGAIFNIDELNAEKITLNNGIDVTTDAEEVTIAANATVKINNVKVTTQKEVTLSAAEKTLKVTPNEGQNDLTFENTTAGNTTITFVGEAGYGSKQEGTITIKSTDGTVKVSGENMNIASNMNIEVEKGVVDISSDTLSGDKNVKVSNSENATTTVKAKTEKEAPAEIVGKTIKLKAYSTEGDITELKNALSIADITEEELAQIQEYVDSFGINGKGATVTVNSANIATITFTEAVSQTTISNIK